MDAWRHHAGQALIASTALTLLLTLNQQQIYARERSQAAEAAAHYADHEGECVDTAEPVAKAQCISDKRKAIYEQKQAIADLRAQQDMSTWTFALMLLGVVGLLASIAGVFLVFENLKATRELFVADKRPWLKVVVAINDADAQKAYRYEGKDWFKLIIRVENVGQLPAYSVRLSGIYALHDGEKQFTAAMSLDRKAYKIRGRTVFPGAEEVYRETLSCSSGDGQFFVSVDLGGFIDYQFDGSDEIHRTPFVWRVSGSLLNGKDFERLNIEPAPHQYRPS